MWLGTQKVVNIGSQLVSQLVSLPQFMPAIWNPKNWSTKPSQACPRLSPTCLSQIKLGTLDQAHAENEFVLRSYINSAKRSKLATVEDEEQQ